MSHHVHSCPECYERVPCSEDCAIELDLALDDGTESGGHVVCDACQECAEDHLSAEAARHAEALQLAEWRGCLIGQAMALEGMAGDVAEEGYFGWAPRLRGEAVQLRRWATEAR